MMSKVLAFALLVGVAAAAVVPPPPTVCPTNGGRLALSSAGMTGMGDFIANVFTYQGGNQPLMTGQPVGPWISVIEGPNSYFIPNATFRASFNIYGNAARTQLIGTGTASSDNMAVVNQGGTSYLGGDMTVITNIPNSPYPDMSDATRINFRSGTFNIHFRAQREHPTDTNVPAIVNTIRWISHVSGQERAIISLWGANGWTGTQFSGQTTGLDLQVTAFCPPSGPIVLECPPCQNPASNFLVPSACIAEKQLIRHHSSDNCITLSFAQSSSTTSNSGCSSGQNGLLPA